MDTLKHSKELVFNSKKPIIYLQSKASNIIGEYFSSKISHLIPIFEKKGFRLIYLPNLLYSCLKTVQSTNLDYDSQLKQYIHYNLDADIINLVHESLLVTCQNNVNIQPCLVRQIPSCGSVLFYNLTEDSDLTQQIEEYLAGISHQRIPFLPPRVNQIRKAAPQPLRITSTFKLFLTDQIEIKLEPLPKCLFLFFLKHKEGVVLKHLSIYKDELVDIYIRLTDNKHDYEKIHKGISRLIDPMDNSCHENISKIKRAFNNTQFEKNIIDDFCISGTSGNIYSIKVDRSLVHYEYE